MTGCRHPSCRPCTSGFTLIELLVVMFLVATLAGLAVMQLGDRGERRELEREARRFQQLVELARQESLRSATQWGVVVEDQGYRFMMLDPDEGQWLEIDQAPWTARSLPDSMRTRLRSEGRPMARELGAGTSTNGPGPAIVLLSSGEISAFELHLEDRRSGLEQALGSDGFQRVQLDGSAANEG